MANRDSRVLADLYWPQCQRTLWLYYNLLKSTRQKGSRNRKIHVKTFTKNTLLPQTLTAQNAGPVKMARLARVPSQLDITGEDRDEEKHHLKQTWSRNESSNRLPGFHKFSNKKSGFDSLNSRVGTSSAIETSFGQHWSHPMVHSPWHFIENLRTNLKCKTLLRTEMTKVYCNYK